MHTLGTLELRRVDVPWVHAGPVLRPVLRKRWWLGQGQADANPLWLKPSQLRHNFISACNAVATRFNICVRHFRWFPLAFWKLHFYKANATEDELIFLQFERYRTLLRLVSVFLPWFFYFSHQYFPAVGSAYAFKRAQNGLAVICYFGEVCS